MLGQSETLRQDLLQPWTIRGTESVSALKLNTFQQIILNLQSIEVSFSLGNVPRK